MTRHRKRPDPTKKDRAHQISLLTIEVRVKESTHLEEFTQSNVIKTVGTVEDDTLLGHGLGKILCGFSFTGSCGTLRGASQVEMQGTEEGSVTTIRQGGDDKTRGISEVLVTVAGW